MKKIINYLVLAVLLVGTLYLFFSKSDIGNLKTLIVNSNKLYILVGVLAMGMYWLMESVMLSMLIENVHRKISLWKTFKLTMIGQYYSHLTPFSSGGQPAQLYEMSKDEIPVGKATAVLVNKFFLFQITVTIYALVLALFRLPLFIQKLSGAFYFIFTGLTFNIVGLAVLLIIAIKPRKFEHIIKKIIDLLKNLKIVKNRDKVVKSVMSHIKDYEKNLKVALENKELFIKLIFLTMIQLTAYFSITYFIYKSLGLSEMNFFDILALQSFLYMAICFIPTPGTVGAAEAGFSSILSIVFAHGFLSYGLLLWRGISFYFSFLISGMVTLFVYVKSKYSKKYEYAGL